MNELFSFGAGVNSVALAILLVEQGWTGAIAFADPGAEHPETYCYMTTFERDFLKPHGLEITRISPVTHPHLYDDKRIGGPVSTLEQYCLQWGIIPLLSVRWCSVGFKGKPLENLRQELGAEASILGIAADEPNRVHYDDPQVQYPLVERGVTRPECIRIIQRAGLPVPRKSGCFFCPGQRVSQWRDLYLHYPDLYERAAAIERTASERCQKWVTLDPHGVSLDQMKARRWEGLMEMDLSEWLPCACAV